MKISENRNSDSLGNKADNKVCENQATNIRNDGKRDLEITSSETNDNGTQDNIPIPLETKETKKVNKKKKKDELVCSNDEDGIIGWFTDDEIPLGEGDRAILELAF